jgi:hypothetical protein
MIAQFTGPCAIIPARVLIQGTRTYPAGWAEWDPLYGKNLGYEATEDREFFLSWSRLESGGRL